MDSPFEVRGRSATEMAAKLGFIDSMGSGCASAPRGDEARWRHFEGVETGRFSAASRAYAAQRH